MIADAAIALLASDVLRGASLRPHARSLFVAWNGVVVLAFDGFPPALAVAKERLGALPGLPPEKFGSKWPKATLGAERDGSAPLTLDELRILRDLCDEHSRKISASEVTVPVTSLSVVEYEQRGLEMLKRRADVALSKDDEAAVAERPSAEERARVGGVLSEWNDLEAYLPKVNAPGSRIRSYRSCSPHGVTCVAFLALPDALRQILATFKADADKVFPGRYAWLEETSLHCTLRSLD